MDWKNFETQLTNWLFQYGPAIVLSIIIFIIGFWLIRIFSKWIKTIFEKRRVDPSLRYFLQNLLVITGQILIILLALQVAGIQLSFFTAILAGLTVAAGLALSGTLQNFVSGLLILLLKPYNVGDTIIIQGQEGNVTSIQLFYTLILTFDNKTIIVPNGQLSNNAITNLSRQGKRRIDLELSFLHKFDIKEIRKIILESVATINGLPSDTSPRIGVIKLEADKFTVSIQIWAQAPGFEDTKMMLQERLLDLLKKNSMLTI